MMKNKVLMFGLTGAVGCLLGCLLGEGLLKVGLPEETEASTPSLVASPEPPVLSSPDTVAPELPGIPELPEKGDVHIVGHVQQRVVHAEKDVLQFLRRDFVGQILDPGAVSVATRGGGVFSYLSKK